MISLRQWLDAHEIPREGIVSPISSYAIVVVTYVIGFGIGVYAAFGYLLDPSWREARPTVGFNSGDVVHLFVASLAIVIAVPLLNLEAPTWWRRGTGSARWRNEARAFGLATICIAVGLGASNLLMDMPDYPRGVGMGAALGDLLSALMAGPGEEIVVLVVPVVFLRAARWPWWAVFAAAVILRVAFHVYYGPAAAGLSLWAIGMVLVYLHTNAVLGLIGAHSYYDVASTVASYGSQDVGMVMAALPLFAAVSYYWIKGVRWFFHRRRHTAAARVVSSDPPQIRIRHVRGDLLEQPVEAIVNAWNPNYMPRWWPSSGVSGALKKRTGPGPWRELSRRGLMPHGTATVTGPGDMAGPNYLIHVAGLNLFWRASRAGVRDCARSAVQAAHDLGVRSLAMPLIGAGTGGLSEASALLELEAGLAEFVSHSPDALEVIVVTYGAETQNGSESTTWH